MSREEYIKLYYKSKTREEIAKELGISKVTVSRIAKRLGIQKLKHSKEEFISKAISIHGNKYDYSSIDYTDSQTKVVIICPDHGAFTIKPSKHLYGQKCYKCSKKDTAKKLSLTKDRFIEQCSKIYNNKYDYSLVECTNQYDRVKIICPYHGIFEQVAKLHRRNGCGKCGKELGSGWTKEDWSKRLINGRTLKLYYIKCWNDDEVFFKIGLTCKPTVEDRFRGELKMPYNYEIIEFREGGIELYDLEISFKKEINRLNDRYIPKIKFNGGTYECFKGSFTPDFKNFQVYN